MKNSDLSDIPESDTAYMLESNTASADCPDKKDNSKWMCRMCSLTEDQQKKISDKYYGGTMPWKKNQNKLS